MCQKFVEIISEETSRMIHLVQWMTGKTEVCIISEKLNTEIRLLI